MGEIGGVGGASGVFAAFAVVAAGFVQIVVADDFLDGLGQVENSVDCVIESVPDVGVVLVGIGQVCGERGIVVRKGFANRWGKHLSRA